MSIRESKATHDNSEQEVGPNDHGTTEPLLQKLGRPSRFFDRLCWFCGISAVVLILFLLKACAIALTADDY